MPRHATEFHSIWKKKVKKQTHERTGTLLLAGSVRRRVMQGGSLECAVEQLE